MAPHKSDRILATQKVCYCLVVMHETTEKDPEHPRIQILAS